MCSVCEGVCGGDRQQIGWMLKIYLLQVKLVKALQLPFHLLGGGPNPLSLKLSDSDQIPVSSIPIMMLLSVVVLCTCFGKPTKSHDLVV